MTGDMPHLEPESGFLLCRSGSELTVYERDDEAAQARGEMLNRHGEGIYDITQRWFDIGDPDETYRYLDLLGLYGPQNLTHLVPCHIVSTCVAWTHPR